MTKQAKLPCHEIFAIIGLGNPGPRFDNTRHNIGFAVLDMLAEQEHISWISKKLFEYCTMYIHDKKIILIKPLTFMNESGKVIPFLQKQGIQQQNILVVHDDIDIPFGVIKEKFGGSARGHNGLKSIITHGGPDFYRLRIGVDRPVHKEHVPHYVLEKFQESPQELHNYKEEAISYLMQRIKLCY